MNKALQLPLTEAVDVLTEHGKSPAQILDSLTSAEAAATDQSAQNTDFDWGDSEAVVLPEQPETAVYWNPRGELVIRQRRWPDDDPVIYITPANLGTFLDRLTDICGIPSVGKP